MSHARDRRPPPLNLDSHSDVSSGQSTQSTTMSALQEQTVRALQPLPRPPVSTESSLESGSGAFPGSDLRNSSVAISSGYQDNPLHNSFAARALQQERNALQAESEQNNNALPLTQSEDRGHAQHSNQDTAAHNALRVSHGAYVEEDAFSTVSLSTTLPDVHSYPDPASASVPTPPSANNNAEHGQVDLPPRPEPRAISTVDRMQRVVRRILDRESSTADQSVEMTAFHQASNQEQGRQSRDGAMQSQAHQTQQVQQTHNRRWLWPVFSLLGIGLGLALYLSTTR